MLNDKEYKIKEVKAIEKELKKLHYAKMNLGTYRLKKPLHKGWFKHLVLRDDVSRRKDALVFQNIIDVAGLEVLGNDKKQADKAWRCDMKRNKCIQEPGLFRLDDKEYKGLLPKAQKYFEGFEVSWSHWRGSKMVYYCRVPQYYFVQSYTKAFITHRKIINPMLDKNISELKSILMKNEYYEYNRNEHRYKDEWQAPFSQKRARRKVNMILTNLYENDETDEFVYKDATKIT